LVTGHDLAPDEVITTLLDVVVDELVRPTAARRLLIVNGHGGNGGILEAASYEL
jgi:creatinine amidohydrolase